MTICKRGVYKKVFANDLDAFIPELWANESVLLLEENMVAAGLIHRDFENVLARFGDIVNTRKPGAFVAKRKTNDDSVVVQDATADNIQVPLDQHFHVSFIIKDGEETKSFKELVDEYLVPSMQAMARAIDLVVLGQVYQFLVNSSGKLGTISDTVAKAYILATRKIMNENKAWMNPRDLMLTPNSETELLKLDLFIGANTVGDDGTAMKEASLGKKLGFEMFMAQNTPSVATGNTTRTNAVNNVGGYPIGATAITYDGAGNPAVGEWLTIAGDMTPQHITADTGTVLTISPGLRYAVVDDAVITTYQAGAVNLGAGYDAGYSKKIVVDGFTVAPQVGQLVSFGNDTDVYAIIEVDGTTGITLDRPLEVAIADDDTVNIGPAGDYNFAFHKNALALVVRPLAPPKAGTGALAGVAVHNNVAMRTVITYDGDKQGHLVTFDLLCGIQVLDTDLGAVMLG